jgi:hypothetical protein
MGWAGVAVCSYHVLRGGLAPLPRRSRPFQLAMVLVIAAPLVSSAAESPVVSAIRYTLEIEVGGQQYSATSVVQRTAAPRSSLPPDRAGSNSFKVSGEGLGIVLADGRALVSTVPTFIVPPGYDAADASKVAEFVAEGKSYPVSPVQLSAQTSPNSAFVFDSAIAPKTAWRFDWLDPAGTLGPGARIVRFVMTPTRDPPTFDLGKIVPWVVIDRRNSPIVTPPDDYWFGLRAYQAKVRQPEVQASAKPVEMISDTGRTTWLDATDSFAFASGWAEKVSDVRPIGVNYSDGLARVTLLPEETPGPPTPYVQRARIPKHRPGNPYEFWSPDICVSPAGCASILDRGPKGMPAGALIDPATEVVYLVELDYFTTGKDSFQRGEE